MSRVVWRVRCEHGPVCAEDALTRDEAIEYARRSGCPSCRVVKVTIRSKPGPKMRARLEDVIDMLGPLVGASIGVMASTRAEKALQMLRDILEGREP